MILKRCLKLAAGTTAIGFGTIIVGVVSFSPSMSSMVLRRRKLLGENSEISSRTEPKYAERVAALRDSTGLFRFATASATVGAVAFDYWMLKRSKPSGDAHTLDQTNDDNRRDQYVQLKKVVNERSAQRIYQLCRRLGGVYTKLGQYIATLNHILPSVWTETLVTLQDSAASMSLVEDGLQLMIENELDAPLHELFSEFDKVPIAAASLAQVHRAVLKSNGDEVAVKVQYPHLGVQVVGDLWAMEVLSAVVGFFFPDFNLGWLLPEFEETADMELDFVQELKNNQRIAAMLAGRCDVYVPYAIEKYSSRKVLTMEFVRGLRVDDVHGIKMAELAPLDIANTITSVFGEMIYCHGFIHCDPHPGNLLIRRKTKARKDSWRWWKWWFGSSCEYELLLLDHGMYRRLEPAFRRAHCRLWKALLTQDIILGQACAKELNIDPIAVETISMMLTLRTPTSITRAGDRISSSEKSQLKKKYKNATAGDINRFIESLPRDLLFILRTNDIVRSLNKTLGGSTRARLLLMGDWSVRGLSIPFCTLSEDQFVGINLSLSQSSNRRRLNLQVDSEYSKNHIFPQISTFFKTTELWILRFKLWLLDAVFTMLRLKKERLANK